MWLCYAMLQAKFNKIHKKMIREYCEGLSATNDPQDIARQQADCRLAAEFLSGRIHSNSAMYTMMRMMASKADKERRGLSRTCVSGGLEGISAEDFDDATFQLASCLRSGIDMSYFGRKVISLSKARRVGNNLSCLPNFYCDFESEADIAASAKSALMLCKALFTRLYMVLWDDTVFAPGVIVYITTHSQTLTSSYTYIPLSLYIYSI